MAPEEVRHQRHVQVPEHAAFPLFHRHRLPLRAFPHSLRLLS
jgi:hypothetical protein